ncbi:cathepsin L-like [Drosophila innubila]|uniref:cathepsin L-like n=1 Tax=Drosophila innubila TaxID=198719 RepID=UPI00148C3BC0|nr:cathepsin L-like [Drosophila innubila]
MKRIISLVCLVGFVQAFSWEWEEYKRSHNKIYEDESEEELRWRTFNANKEIIDRHNEQYAAGKETFEMGVNQFTDLSPNEFESLMLSSQNMTEDEEDLIYDPPKSLKIPKSVDWRKLNAVTPVKDQGKCGSCWAFAAVATLEGRHFLKTKELINLSEQNLVDCSKRNKGCNGGLITWALKYIKKNRGIDTAKSYPYEAEQHHCRFSKLNVGATVLGIKKVRKRRESELAAAVATEGPIGVAVDASPFHHYRRGVLRKRCHKRANHAVTVVGYGTDHKGLDYWLVKNSWGTPFGENGYIRMARNHHNLCHIASHAVYPVV